MTVNKNYQKINYFININNTTEIDHHLFRDHTFSLLRNLYKRSVESNSLISLNVILVPPQRLDL